jgi:protoporphyrinogen oxidase
MGSEGSEQLGRERTGPVPCTILGGGVAGLALACAARERDIPFTLYEASPRLGGNAATLRRGEFSFDAGAHRFHDRIAHATRKIQGFLGSDLHRVDAPSRIRSNGTFIDFPLSPLNLVSRLPAGRLLQASFDLLRARLRRRRVARNLEEYAVDAYGRTIAGTFLTNYSEKLWGLPCRRLSAAAAGKRMRGLDLKTFLLETIQRSTTRTAHLDGIFYYPRGGIGRITEALAANAPPGRCGSGSRSPPFVTTGAGSWRSSSEPVRSTR